MRQTFKAEPPHVGLHKLSKTMISQVSLLSLLGLLLDTIKVTASGDGPAPRIDGLSSPPMETSKTELES